MVEQNPPQLPSVRGKSCVGTPFHPRLGDLALDLARGEEGEIGVVVALPDKATASYHLHPLREGHDWCAPANGTTLCPVSAPVTHVTPLHHDASYDPRAQQGALPVQVHHENGKTSESLLILTPGQVELYRVQLDQLIGGREHAQENGW
ncbi:hypothetical protein FHS42_001260 [Streptomyces zagrosensis]|uniref:Uncharacterized protein n=1 Tax=Streptomyces zagrosensis TaxID=1042984 RepID=A0A7W9Q5Y2_9ACTN|nr:hypothetical protein [Streptomyces zagrosensis]